jgi:hypothetical protein
LRGLCRIENGDGASKCSDVITDDSRPAQKLGVFGGEFCLLQL